MALAVLTKARRLVAERNTYGLPQGDSIRRELKSWFRSQQRAVLAFVRTGKIESKDDTGAVPEIPNFDVFSLGDGDMAKAMTPLLEAIYDTAGQSFTSRVGLDPNSWQVTNPNTQAAIDDAALAFSAATNETTSLQIADAIAATRQSLAEGLITRGETLEWLTKQINEIFDGAATWRARRIAASEASRAVHAAQEIAAYQSGVVTGWRWLLSEDACPLCRMVAAECPTVKLGEAFAVIGDNPIYSTIKFPPLHPSCQCTIVEVLDIDEQPAWGTTLIQPTPDEEGREVPVPEPAPAPVPAPAPPPTPKPVLPRTPAPTSAPALVSEPVPLPKPVPVSKPAENPVGAALDVQASGNTGDAIRSVIKTIDGVHKGGDLPKIPVVAKDEARSNGFFRFSEVAGAKSIEISTRGEHPRLTVAHEIGHFLEYSGIPKPFTKDGLRDFGADPRFEEWKAAVDASEASRKQLDLTRKKSVPWPGATGGGLQYSVDKKHLKYLMSDEEVWARAYSQYVATKSGDEGMKAELDRMRKTPYERVYASQWSDEDFKPIAAAMDKIFGDLGWRA